MGLTGLVGGGVPAFASTLTSTGNGASTVAPHPVGTQAVDSSGGIYVLARLASTASPPGSLHSINSSIGTGHAVVVPISTGTTGSVLGVKMVSSGGSTDMYAWFQVYGPGTVLGGSSAGAAGSRLFASTVTAGAVETSSGGLAIDGIQTTSSNASSLWNVFLSWPEKQLV